MNYRHAFHAGNFADLVKHACLTVMLEHLTGGDAPLTVIDTHAGAGAYDLGGEMALKSGEAAIARLLADESAPEAYDMLKAAVVRANSQGGVRIYPGSPALTCAGLREGDRLIACELRPDDHAALTDLLQPLAPQARALREDGFEVAASQTPTQGAVLLLIDPPFERPDDYPRVAQACTAVLRRNPKAVIAIWTPLKDLETFDGFLRRLEDVPVPETLICEVRLRPLTDPVKLNGCTMVIVNPWPELDEQMRAITGWAAQNLGEPGNDARVWRL